MFFFSFFPFFKINSDLDVVPIQIALTQKQTKHFLYQIQIGRCCDSNCADTKWFFFCFSFFRSNSDLDVAAIHCVDTIRFFFCFHFLLALDVAAIQIALKRFLWKTDSDLDVAAIQITLTRFCFLFSSFTRYKSHHKSWAQFCFSSFRSDSDSDVAAIQIALKRCFLFFSFLDHTRIRTLLRFRLRLHEMSSFSACVSSFRSDSDLDVAAFQISLTRNVSFFACFLF